MSEKLIIVIEDGLVAEILCDPELAEQIGSATVLNIDNEAPDARARNVAYNRICSLPWIVELDYVHPPEIGENHGT